MAKEKRGESQTLFAEREREGEERERRERAKREKREREERLVFVSRSRLLSQCAFSLLSPLVSSLLFDSSQCPS